MVIICSYTDNDFTLYVSRCRLTSFECFDIEMKLNFLFLQIWRGFSGPEDYDHSLDWNLWLWAPKECHLEGQDETEVLNLQLRGLAIFKFSNPPQGDYDIGVNMEVIKCDCDECPVSSKGAKDVGSLVESCISLQDEVFAGIFVTNNSF